MLLLYRTDPTLIKGNGSLQLYWKMVQAIKENVQ